MLNLISAIGWVSRTFVGWLENVMRERHGNRMNYEAIRLQGEMKKYEVTFKSKQEAYSTFMAELNNAERLAATDQRVSLLTAFARLLRQEDFALVMIENDAVRGRRISGRGHPRRLQLGRLAGPSEPERIFPRVIEVRDAKEFHRFLRVIFKDFEAGLLTVQASGQESAILGNVEVSR